MKNVIWIVIGVVIGLLVARRLDDTYRGKRFFAELDAKAREFGEAISDGYRQREAELRAALGDADSLSDEPSRA